MRLLVLLCCMMSFSSCLAVLGGGLLATTMAMNDSKAAYREGAAREAAMRAQHAREAALARQSYNEAMRESGTPWIPVSQARVQPAPTPPPLVQVEPARVPLRPR